jgi:hypothetical protein
MRKAEAARPVQLVTSAVYAMSSAPSEAIAARVDWDDSSASTFMRRAGCNFAPTAPTYRSIRSIATSTVLREQPLQHG